MTDLIVFLSLAFIGVGTFPAAYNRYRYMKITVKVLTIEDCLQVLHVVRVLRDDSGQLSLSNGQTPYDASVRGDQAIDFGIQEIDLWKMSTEFSS